MTSSERGHEPSEGGFADRVVAVVAATRPGEVVTYGEVAAEAGRPRAARAVGRVLRDHGGGLPWWRVVTADGRLVPGNETEHADRLTAEGVAVDRTRGRVRRATRDGDAAPRISGR